MITCAPISASATAVSLPIPLLPPVITATLPCMSVTCGVRSSADGERSSPGWRAHPVDQLVAEEADLAPAGKAVRRHPFLAHHAPQVLDVHVQQVGRHRGGEDRREAALDRLASGAPSPSVVTSATLPRSRNIT